MTAENCPNAQAEPRRGFLIQSLTLALSGIIALFPFAAGLLVFVDPLRAKQRSQRDDTAGGPEGFYNVARLDALPDDGTPQYVKVVAGRTDAWTYIPNEPIGAVYLSKTQADEVLALNVMCPHAGCAVNFNSRQRDFQCPCHSSSFSIDGKRSEDSPSARNLDKLRTEIKDGEVWVEFKNFRTGTAERIPVT